MRYGCVKDVLLLVIKDLKSMVQCLRISLETLITHHQNIKMIASETPYKLAEIIRDTWPVIYRPSKKSYNTKSQKDKNV